MRQRLSVVTLGVKDKGRARAFYEALGWRSESEASGDDPVFFQSGDMVVALWDRTLLAEDSGVEDTGGWGGITLAHNVASRQEVDAITDVARGAGATVAREPGETFWGGYNSMIIDLDGHPWEIAHNPGWQMTEDGGVRMA
jgi:uncharacterized protein